MSLRAEFEAENPDVHVLSADQAGRVDLVMGAVGWLGDEEQVRGCTSLGGQSSTVIRVELQELRGVELVAIKFSSENGKPKFDVQHQSAPFVLPEIKDDFNDWGEERYVRCLYHNRTNAS